MNSAVAGAGRVCHAGVGGVVAQTENRFELNASVFSSLRGLRVQVIIQVPMGVFRAKCLQARGAALPRGAFLQQSRRLCVRWQRWGCPARLQGRVRHRNVQHRPSRCVPSCRPRPRPPEEEPELRAELENPDHWCVERPVSEHLTPGKGGSNPP